MKPCIICGTKTFRKTKNKFLCNNDCLVEHKKIQQEVLDGYIKHMKGESDVDEFLEEFGDKLEKE